MVRSILAVLLLALLPVRVPAQECADCDGDGYAWPADCNDASRLIHPGQEEICNGLDEDCNGLPDDHPSCLLQCEAPGHLGPETRVTPGTTRDREPSLAWTGTGYGMVWSDGRLLHFAALDLAGNVVSDPRPVTLAPSRPAHASLVWNGTEFGLAFDDLRDAPRLGRQIFFLRLGADGRRLSSETRVSESDCDTGFPSLAWTGMEYGIAWEDCRGAARDWQIYFARVGASGGRRDGELPVTTTPGASFSPSLAWNGTGYGVTWHDLRPLPGSGGNFEIFLARLDASGVRLGPETRLTTAVGSGLETSLAWSGREYAVAWHDRRDDPALLSAQVYLVRAGADGAKLAGEVRLTAAGLTAEYPSLVWTGAEYGLAWTQLDLSSSPFFQVRFLRVHEMGFPLGDPVLVSLGDGDAWRPALAWNGTGFGAAWDDNRHGGREIFFGALGCETDQDACDPADADRAPGRLVACRVRRCMAAARSGELTPRECAASLRETLPPPRSRSRAPGTAARRR